MGDIYFNGTVVPGNTYFNGTNVCLTGDTYFNGVSVGECGPIAADFNWTQTDTTEMDFRYKVSGDLEWSDDNITWNTSSSTLMTFTGAGTFYVRSASLTDIRFGSISSTYGPRITDINLGIMTGLTSGSSMFHSCSSLTSLDLSGLDTSSMDTMSGMFGQMTMPTIDVSGFDTANVTNMGGMFSLSDLSSIDVSNFDTSKVTDMNSMFRGTEITSIDLSSFVMSLVDTTYLMFYQCGSLVDFVPFSGTVAAGCNSQAMFGQCSVIEHIDMFDSSGVSNFEDFFGLCGLLDCIDKIDTTNQTITDDLFNGCSSLTAPDAGDQTTILGGSNWVNPGACPVVTDLVISWTSQSSDTSASFDADMEYSNDGGSTFGTLTAGTAVVLASGTSYILREINGNGLTYCRFDIANSPYFDGTMTVTGGDSLTSAYRMFFY